jgi:hypothetical protein
MFNFLEKSQQFRFQQAASAPEQWRVPILCLLA